MLVLFCLVSTLILPFKSKSRLEAENVALRHQVMVLRRQVGGRVHLTNLDRLFLVFAIGFRRSGACSLSFGERRSFVVIGPAFAAIGVGSAVLPTAGSRHSFYRQEVRPFTDNMIDFSRSTSRIGARRTFLPTHASDIAAVDSFVVPSR